MNILFVGDFSFPFGSASASRIRHFALGLRARGHGVRVLSQRRLEPRMEDMTPGGVVEYRHIRYEGCSRSGSIKRRPIRHLLCRCQTLIQSMQDVPVMARRARELARAGDVDVIIQYTLSYAALRPFFGFCRSLGIALVRDIVEWPAPSYFPGEGFLHPRFLDFQLGVRRAVLKSDGVIGISDFVTSFYSRHGVPAVCVPAVIAVPEQPPLRPAPSPGDRDFVITYLGNLSPRNGPYEMLDGVRIALERGLPVRFVIVGSSGKAGEDRGIRQACERDPVLRSKVEFRGYLPDDEVTRALVSSDALLFARPDDTCAKAAFPTRLPEYLVSGRPVIAAAVGDIPKYLRHGTDALLFPSGRSETIADHIGHLIALPDHGEAIGRSGFERARQCFNSETNTEKLDWFLQDLVRRKTHG